MGEQKKNFPVIQKWDFKGSFTKRWTFREKIRKQASYTFHISPFQPLQICIDCNMQKETVMSLSYFNIKSSWKKLQSLLFSPNCPERKGSQQLDTAHDFYHGPVGLVLPSLSNSCFWRNTTVRDLFEHPQRHLEGLISPQKESNYPELLKAGLQLSQQFPGNKWLISHTQKSQLDS